MLRKFIFLISFLIVFGFISSVSGADLLVNENTTYDDINN